MIDFKIKKRGVQVKVNGKVLMIPSKQFPVSKPSMLVFQYHDNTEPITDPKIIEIFDSYQYRRGRCFANANDLLSMLQEAGYTDWEYVSGWMFQADNLPVMHAQLTDGKHVLDYSDDLMTPELIDFMMNNDDVDAHREKLIEYTLECAKHKPSEVKVCGQMHQYSVFIGSASNYEDTERWVKTITDEHISYRGGTMRAQELSVTQKRLNQITGGE